MVAVCGVIGGVSTAGYLDTRAGLTPLTARTIGDVVATPDPDTVMVRWTPDGEAERIDAVTVAVDPPAAGTRIEVAYDHAAPNRLVVPGAQELADLDGATTGIAFTAAVLAILVGSSIWQLFTRGRALLRSGSSTVYGRRVRVQRGTSARSWLELDDGRWLPVHFEPALTTLPTPAPIDVHGDGRAAYRAVTVAGPEGRIRLVPSGRMRRTEPLGRRTDNPSAPDSETLSGLHRYGSLRQLRADLGAVVIAPVLGLIWVGLVGGGVLAWVAASTIAAAGGLHVAALRGTDPS